LGVAVAIPFTGMEAISDLVQGGSSIAFLKYLQMVQSIAIFIVPAALAAWLFSEKPAQWLGFKGPKTRWMIMAMVTILAVQPFVSWIGMMNAQLSLPDYLDPLYQWMHQTEKSANQIIFQFLDTKHLPTILFNVLLIAVLPALGEEMLFRGGLQPLIQKVVKNHHVAIWITAFLFSAIHMQFLTFAPRFILGALLGYLLVYGGSIWYPIAAHFFNNLSSLVVFHYYRHTQPDMDPFDPGMATSTWSVALLSLIVAGGFIFLFRKWSDKDKRGAAMSS
ncbi:MAG: CPBP family intramembrane metalloprotease, partial [Bacteroidales bacterium]|nr:CPBP family intramembrane metalloprotease [Bacteroidales bacterium]